MEHQSLVTEGDEGDREVTYVSANTKMATATEVGPTAFNNTHAESQPEHLMAPMNNDTSQNGNLEEVVVVTETSRSEPHSCTDPLQVIQGPPTALEDQPDKYESSHCDREKIQETDQHNSSSDSTSDVKKFTVATHAEEMSSGPSSESFKTGDAVQTEAVGGNGNDR